MLKKTKFLKNIIDFVDIVFLTNSLGSPRIHGLLTPPNHLLHLPIALEVPPTPTPIPHSHPTPQLLIHNPHGAYYRFAGERFPNDFLRKHWIQVNFEAKRMWSGFFWSLQLSFLRFSRLHRAHVKNTLWIIIIII